VNKSYGVCQPFYALSVWLHVIPCDFVAAAGLVTFFLIGSFTSRPTPLMAYLTFSFGRLHSKTETFLTRRALSFVTYFLRLPVRLTPSLL